MLTRRQFTAKVTAATAALAIAPSRLAAGDAAEKRYRIIGFTKPFQRLSFDDTADTVAEIGWDGIECPVRPKGQIEPERAAEELPRLVEALAKRGKKLDVLTTAITSPSQPHTESLLRTAARLGITRYRMGAWRYDGATPIPVQLANLSAQLRDLAALNRELGLQAGYQNHSGFSFVGGPVWDLWTMMKDLDSRQMGVCFDIGHATVEGGTSWRIDARLMESRFTAVFVKDFLWQRTDQGWSPRWVALGDGMVDPSFFRWLRATDFAGPISQHHEYEHGSGREMIAKMKQDLLVLRNWLTSA